MMRCCWCCSCSSFVHRLKDEIQTLLRDYDRLQYIAVILIYIQVSSLFFSFLTHQNQLKVYIIFIVFDFFSFFGLLIIN